MWGSNITIFPHFYYSLCSYKRSGLEGRSAIGPSEFDPRQLACEIQLTVAALCFDAARFRKLWPGLLPYKCFAPFYLKWCCRVDRNGLNGYSVKLAKA